jgi:predicted acylesterase/phospholipase RssA
MMGMTDKLCRLSACLTLVVIVAGCASSRRPFPDEQETLGVVRGYDQDIRVWGDHGHADSSSTAAVMRRQVASNHPEEFKKTQSFIAISGGGQNGAFGAGLLNGWSEEGTRPEFRIVTGISTGSIIAPFAFMGSEYDEQLKAIYTLYSTKEVVHRRLMKALFGGEALTDSKPLLELIGKYVTEEMIEGIAREYAKGRRLFIGTTNLDAGRPVVWDIGKIAASDAPDKANLIHRIILASTSVPAAFPPVFFEVSKDGVEYDELHVDGGISYQLFINPTSASIREFMNAAGFSGDGTVYVIRNTHSNLSWTPVKKNGVAISAASIGGLTTNQGNSDQYIIYLQTKLDDMDFRAARISDEFPHESSEAFDLKYMNNLYDDAFKEAKNGYPWSNVPF